MKSLSNELLGECDTEEVLISYVFAGELLLLLLLRNGEAEFLECSRLSALLREELTV